VTIGAASTASGERRIAATKSRPPTVMPPAISVQTAALPWKR
jgi:hypothetical protein